MTLSRKAQMVVDLIKVRVAHGTRSMCTPEWVLSFVTRQAEGGTITQEEARAILDMPDLLTPPVLVNSRGGAC